MSFTDPLSFTLSGVTTPLPRTNLDEHLGEYTSADGLWKVTASHQIGSKRTRRMLRFDLTKIAPDPFRPSENARASMACYMVFDVPAVGAGFSLTEQQAAYQGFKTLITATSDALVTKLLGGES
jgi:hypothetical protein